MQKRTRSILLGIYFLSIVMVATAQVCSAKEKFQVSGYGNAHMMKHDGLPRLLDKDDPNDAFIQIREFSLFFDFPVSDGILASVEIEAGNDASTLTPNYAYVEVDVPTVFGILRSDSLSGLTFRVGKILVPFLSYNENKPNFRQNLMSQPFTAWNISPVVGSPPDYVGLGWSDTGAIVDWFHEIGDAGLIDIKLAIINGIQSDSAVLDDNAIQLSTGPTVRPRDGLIQNGHEDARDNNQNKATVAKLSLLSTDFPVDVGFSWYQGAWDRGGSQDLTMQGIHLNWLEYFWTLKGEWVTADVEQVAGTPLPGTPALNTSTGDYEMNAFYVEGSVIPLRYGPDGERYLRIVYRYDDVDTNDQASFTPFDRSRHTYGAEWQFAKNTRLRYEFQDHTLDDFDRAPTPFVDAGGKRHVTMHMASIIFWF